MAHATDFIFKTTDFFSFRQFFFFYRNLVFQYNNEYTHYSLTNAPQILNNLRGPQNNNFVKTSCTKLRITRSSSTRLVKIQEQWKLFVKNTVLYVTAWPQLRLVDVEDAVRVRWSRTIKRKYAKMRTRADNVTPTRMPVHGQQDKQPEDCR